MKKNRPQLNTPLRQSPVAIIFIILQALRNVLSSLWPFLLLFFFQKESSNLDLYFLFVGIIAVVFSLTTAIIQYYRYSYWLTEDELHIEKGIFRRSHIVLPYERVQIINTKRNVIHNYTGTEGISIETAGSKKTEFDISALSIDHAQDIKNFVLEQKENLIKDGVISEGTDTISEDSENDEVMKLTFGELLKYGLTHNHFRSFLAIFSLAAVILSQLVEVFNNNITDLVYNTATDALKQGFYIGILVLIGIPVITIIVSVVMNILSYYNLRVLQSGNLLQVKRGLIQTHEQSIKKSRIQMLKWSTNPLRKLIGLNSLKFIQAGSSDNSSGQTVAIAGANDEERDRIIDFSLGKYLKKKSIVLKPADFTKWRSFILFGLLPLGILTAILYFITGIYSLSILLLAFIPLYLVLRWYRNVRYVFNEDTLLIETAVYSRRVKIIELYKTQMVRITQTPYERRRDLCRLHLYTAGGKVSLIFLDLAIATKLKDYILFKVESTNRNWM